MINHQSNTEIDPLALFLHLNCYNRTVTQKSVRFMFFFITYEKDTCMLSVTSKSNISVSTSALKRNLGLK